MYVHTYIYMNSGALTQVEQMCCIHLGFCTIELHTELINNQIIKFSSKLTRGGILLHLPLHTTLYDYIHLIFVICYTCIYIHIYVYNTHFQMSLILISSIYNVLKRICAPLQRLGQVRVSLIFPFTIAL